MVSDRWTIDWVAQEKSADGNWVKWIDYAELQAEVDRLRGALEKIARVNAMDYEYVRWAKQAP